MLQSGDLDPSYPALRYLSDRFELNIEQRYWISFLYSCCYSVPTVFYIYNEFPDYELADLWRMEQRRDRNKSKLIFQTDRRWIKNNNDFVNTIRSYKDLLSGLKQATSFNMLKGEDRFKTYDNVYNKFSKMRNFGRYSLFLFTEAIHQVTGYDMEASKLDLEQAESSCNGLLYALWKDVMIWSKITKNEYQTLHKEFNTIMDRMRSSSTRNNVWNVETTLCAYKKYKLWKRYIGYYIDRMYDEIVKMQGQVTDGVDRSVLWDFRLEHFSHKLLRECNW